MKTEMKKWSTKYYEVQYQTPALRERDVRSFHIVKRSIEERFKTAEDARKYAKEMLKKALENEDRYQNVGGMVIDFGPLDQKYQTDTYRIVKVIKEEV